MAGWFKGWFSGGHQRPAPRRTFRPRLEALEERIEMAVVTVTAGGDGAGMTLRAAIAAANDGDTVQFGIANQTITLTQGAIAIAKKITIDGGNQAITLSGNNASQIFTIVDDANAPVTINKLTFINGKAVNANGGAINDQGSLVLNNDTFNNNTADGKGGAVYLTSHFVNDTFNVNNSNFTSNDASYGGALYASSIGGISAASLVLNTDAFTSNTSNFSGGAVYTSGVTGAQGGVTGVQILGNSHFTNNKVTGSGQADNFNGGAIFTTDPLTVNGDTFDTNSAAGGGGAIDYAPTSGNNSGLSVVNTTFKNNTAGGGGGLYSNVQTDAGTINVSISGSTFNNNTANGTSGAYDGGGGVFLVGLTSGSGTASATITNSTFYQNNSDSIGGGIALNLNNTGTGRTSATFTSLTVYKNQAATAGGGIWVSTGNPLQGSPLLVLHNSIVAGNSINNPATDGPDIFGKVDVQQSTFNLVGQAGSTAGNVDGWARNNQNGTAGNPQDPGLDPTGLASNGGPTQTVKLLSSSVGYRNGDPTLAGTTDQRGVVRRTYVSIGAYDPDAS